MIGNDFPFIMHTDIIDNGYNIVQPHWHENIELLCFTEGCATVQINTEQFTASAGECVVINSCCLHNITAKQHCVYYCVIIRLSYLMQLGLPVGQTICSRIRNEHINCLFEEMLREYYDKPSHYKEYIKARAAELVIMLYREYKTSPYTKQKPISAVRKAITIIDGYYTDDISIASIGAELGYNKYYLCHIFKTFTGSTVTDYINLSRCRYARELLLEGELSVADIAVKCGFASLSYFSKVYKKHMGTNPSEAINTNIEA